jgi:polyribonucleotide nucleotidyltransferase
MIRAQRELAQQVGKRKREMPLMTVNQEILEVAYQIAGDRIEGALYNAKKVDRSKAVKALKDEVQAAVIAKFRKPTSSRSHRRSITCRRRPSASACSTSRSAWTAAATTTCARSNAK